MRESYLPARERKTKVAGTAWMGSLIALILRVLMLIKDKHPVSSDAITFIAAFVFGISLIYWLASKLRK
jgi:hypothetical protein